MGLLYTRFRSYPGHVGGEKKLVWKSDEIGRSPLKISSGRKKMPPGGDDNVVILFSKSGSCETKTMFYFNGRMNGPYRWAPTGVCDKNNVQDANEFEQIN